MLRVRHRSRVAHLKFARLQPITLRRYRVAVHRFFVFIDHICCAMPASFDELDAVATEFVSPFYQNDCLLGWATCFCCGTKRLCATRRHNLDATVRYFSPWVKSTRRVRACPLTSDFFQGAAAIAFVKEWPQFSCALLLGFVGLFRIGELFALAKCLLLSRVSGSEAVVQLAPG